MTPDQYAQQRGIPKEAQYTVIFADLITCASGVPQATAAPTDADLRQVYDNVVAARKGQEGQEPLPPFEQIKDQIAQNQDVQQAFATKSLYNAIASDERVVVNPRYRPLTLETSQSIPLHVVIGGTASDAVVAGPANAAS